MVAIEEHRERAAQAGFQRLADQRSERQHAQRGQHQCRRCGTTDRDQRGHGGRTGNLVQEVERIGKRANPLKQAGGTAPNPPARPPCDDQNTRQEQRRGNGDRLHDTPRAVMGASAANHLDQRDSQRGRGRRSTLLAPAARLDRPKRDAQREKHAVRQQKEHAGPLIRSGILPCAAA